MDDDRVIPAVRYINNSPDAASSNSAAGTGSLSNSSTNVDYASSIIDSPGVINPDLGVMELIQMAVVYAFIIAAALSAVFIFVGGISFILSGGNDEKIKQAINTIRYSIIGLIIVILSFTFVTIVGRMFGLNFLDYLKYNEIKNSVNRLIRSGTQPVDTFEIQQ